MSVSNTYQYGYFFIFGVSVLRDEGYDDPRTLWKAIPFDLLKQHCLQVLGSPQIPIFHN